MLLLLVLSFGCRQRAQILKKTLEEGAECVLFLNT